MHHPLGTLLLQEHMLKEDDLERVEAACRKENCSFEDAVARLGLLTKDTIQVFKEHLPSMALTQLVETDPVLLDLITPDQAHRYLCIPVANMGGTLTVALSDPSESALIDGLARETGKPVDAVPALESDLERAVAYHYGEEEAPVETAAGPEPAAAEPVPAEEPAADAGGEEEEDWESAIEGLGPSVPPTPMELPDQAREVSTEPPRHTRADILVEDLRDPPPQVLFANRLLSQMVLREADRVEIRWKGDKMAEAAIFEGGNKEVLSAITPDRASQVIQRYRVLADMLLQSRKKPQSGRFTVKIRFEDGIARDQKFRLNVVPLGEQEGEAATLFPALEENNQISSTGPDSEEKPSRCPSCGAPEVLARFRYCPVCGVAVG